MASAKQDQDIIVQITKNFKNIEIVGFSKDNPNGEPRVLIKATK